MKTLPAIWMRVEQMAKFNITDNRRVGVTSPVTTEAVSTGPTREGGRGYRYDNKGALYLLSVANFVGEKSFYEDASTRDGRFEQLVHAVAGEDPAWMVRFLRWLRTDAAMRSASLVGAAEFVAARRGKPDPDGYGPQAVDAVLRRADEPGEMLAYWAGKYGMAFPKGMKKGIASAVLRLYSERAWLKYDTDDTPKPFRFGRVLDLTHPATEAPWQRALFDYALTWWHREAEARKRETPEILTTIRARKTLTALPKDQRRAVLTAPGGPEQLRAAGMTWEAVGPWLGGPMDRAAWEALIPSMPIFAQLRNLRNFDQAGVSDDIAALVTVRLADPDVIGRSGILPMQILAAYRNAPNLRWSHPLDKALALSLTNIPALPGRTLILVDTSQSMDNTFSKDGSLKRWDAAAIFGLALAQRCADAELVSFSSTARYWGEPHGANTKVFPLQAGESLLRAVERWKSGGWFLGGGTETAAALRRHYRNHDRVVILTDEQATQDGTEVSRCVPDSTPLITLNLAGYERGHAPAGTATRVTVGGLTDAGFKMIPLIDGLRSATWPF